MRLADAGSLCMMGMVFATVALFFRLFTFLDKRLTTVKHAFGVECRPGRSVLLYDCLKVSLGPNIPMYDKKKVVAALHVMAWNTTLVHSCSSCVPQHIDRCLFVSRLCCTFAIVF